MSSPHDKNDDPSKVKNADDAPNDENQDKPDAQRPLTKREEKLAAALAATGVDPSSVMGDDRPDSMTGQEHAISPEDFSTPKEQ